MVAFHVQSGNSEQLKELQFHSSLLQSQTSIRVLHWMIFTVSDDPLSKQVSLIPPTVPYIRQLSTQGYFSIQYLLQPFSKLFKRNLILLGGESILAIILNIPGNKKLLGYLLHHQLGNHFPLNWQPKMRLKTSACSFLVLFFSFSCVSELREAKSVCLQLVLKNSNGQFMNFHRDFFNSHLISPSAW